MYFFLKKGRHFFSYGFLHLNSFLTFSMGYREMEKLYPTCGQLWPIFLFSFEVRPLPSKIVILEGDDWDLKHTKSIFPTLWPGWISLSWMSILTQKFCKWFSMFLVEIIWGSWSPLLESGTSFRVREGSNT